MTELLKNSPETSWPQKHFFLLAEHFDSAKILFKGKGFFRKPLEYVRGGVLRLKHEDIFKDLPTLETERLILRKMTPDDAEDVFAYASELDVAKFVPWEVHRSLEDSRRFVDYVLKLYEAGKPAPWAIEWKENGKMIGTIDYVAWYPGHFRAEIGFILSKAYWGKGIAPEAARKVMEFGFERMGLNRIEAECMAENVQSQRALQKLGMRLEGISRQKYFIKGKFRDMALYSILKQEFEREAGKRPGARP